MTSAEKQRQIDITELAGLLEVVYTAFCVYCGTDIQSNRTEQEFAKQIYDKGWCISDFGDMCCPECAKTHITN
jgi:hypothetical protein